MFSLVENIFEYENLFCGNLMQGIVILLNGCSSAGKTTLARELQNISVEPLHHIALDQFRDGLPPSLRGMNSKAGDPGSRGLNVVPQLKDDKLVTSITFGDYGEKVLKVMRRAAAHLANIGCSVVIDDILFKKDYLMDYAKVLNPDRSWLVAVRCELNVVRAREKKRPGRFPGTADSHYDSIHDHGAAYDIEVDTTSQPVSKVAEEIINQIQRHPSALSNLVTD